MLTNASQQQTTRPEGLRQIDGNKTRILAPVKSPVRHGQSQTFGSII